MPRVGHVGQWRGARLGLSALVVLLVAGATPVLATMTMRLDLAQLVAATDRAFVGRVVSVRSGRDTAGLPSTWVTFAVDQVIKGKIGGELTMKQFGTMTPLSDGSMVRLPGLPSYTPGEEMVVFLSGESDGGFCSPIGLAQGKFPIVRRGGEATVRATVENIGILQSVHRLQTTRAQFTGDVTLNDFLDQVAPLVAEPARP